jgi:acyl-ACP thioesterase
MRQLTSLDAQFLALESLAALVPEPASGRVFEREIRPGIADVSASGRARLDAIARWLQDVAYADLVDAGFEGRGAWIVRRTRLRVDSFPRFGEDLTLRTFCSGIGRFSAERRTDVVARGAARVQAVALWICLDPEARRPMRFSEDFVAAYAPSAGGRDANVRLRHPDPPPDATREAWRFRASEVDAAGHVNNSHYWVPLEEDLAMGPEPEAIDAEVEYRDPAQPGEFVLLRSESSLWVVSPDGALHASILHQQRGRGSRSRR